VPTRRASTTIFALPSNYEAFPYVLLEAAARGLPIVTTRVGGAEDVVYDDINSYVVDSTEQPSSSLLRISSDRKKRLKMSRAPRNRTAEFNVDRMISETMNY